MAGYLAIGTLGLGAAGAAYKLYQSCTQSPKEEEAVREAPSQEQTAQKIKQFNETTYKSYQSKLKTALETLKDRLKAIDPQLVHENRVGWFSNFFAWISRCWNRAVVADLKPKYEALRAETKKSCPSSEKDISEWAKTTPQAIRSALGSHKSVITRLKADYINAAKNPKKLPEVSAEESSIPSLEEAAKESSKLLETPYTLESVAKAAGEEVVAALDADKSNKSPTKKQELIVQYLKIKLEHPELRDKTGEPFETFTFESTLGTLTVKKGTEYSMRIGGDCPQKTFRSLLMMQMYSEDPNINKYIADKMFPSDIQALLTWKDKRGDVAGYEVFFDQPKKGTVIAGTIQGNGNRDFEHSKFVTGKSIKCSIDPQTQVLHFDGEGMRLGLSMRDYSKPLAGLSPIAKTIVEPILNRAYNEGVKLTLNLKSLRVAQDPRDEKIKIEAVYQRNKQNPIPLDRGSILGTSIEKYVPEQLRVFMDIDEFQATFKNLEWTNAE